MGYSVTNLLASGREEISQLQKTSYPAQQQAF